MNPIVRLFSRLLKKESSAQAASGGAHTANPAQPHETTAPAPQTASQTAPQTMPPLSIPERRVRLIGHAAGQLLELAQAMPESGLFPPIGTNIRYPGTENLCRLVVEPAARNPQRRVLIASAARKSTDMAVSRYILLDAGRNEVLAYLQSDTAAEALRAAFDALSDAVDQKWT